MLISFQECVRALRTPVKTVLHVGAHHGEEAIQYHQNGVEEVIWVEGNKQLLRVLHAHLAQFPTRHRIIHSLVSDVDGQEVDFNITNNGQSSSILELGTHLKHHPQVFVTETKKQKTKTLDSLMAENKVDCSKIDFMNLDIQGAELLALKGFENSLREHKNIKAIYCEINEEELYKGAPLTKEIDEYLKQFGFKRAMAKLTQYMWGDALYIRK